MLTFGLNGEGRHLDTLLAKTCTICGETKPLDRYYSRGDRKGLRAECKDCNRATRAVWYQEHKDEQKQRVSSWMKRNPEKRRAYHLKSAYGITQADYERMHAEQEGRCGICFEPHDVLMVDHNHDTNKVRGLLCRKCNRSIGQLGENPETLRRAAAWVER